MGTIVHHAAIVTSHDLEHLGRARVIAGVLFDNMTGCVPSMMNGYWSFFIPSSGSNLGWEVANLHAAKLREFEAMVGSEELLCEIAFVRYGETEPIATHSLLRPHAPQSEAADADARTEGAPRVAAVINAITSHCCHLGDPLAHGMTSISGIEVCSGCAPTIEDVLAAIAPTTEAAAREVIAKAFEESCMSISVGFDAHELNATIGDAIAHYKHENDIGGARELVYDQSGDAADAIIAALSAAGFAVVTAIPPENAK